MLWISWSNFLNFAVSASWCRFDWLSTKLFFFSYDWSLSYCCITSCFWSLISTNLLSGAWLLFWLLNLATPFRFLYWPLRMEGGLDWAEPTSTSAPLSRVLNLLVGVPCRLYRSFMFLNLRLWTCFDMWSMEFKYGLNTCCCFSPAASSILTLCISPVSWVRSIDSVLDSSDLFDCSCFDTCEPKVKSFFVLISFDYIFYSISCCFCVAVMPSMDIYLCFFLTNLVDNLPLCTDLPCTRSCLVP